MVYKIAWTVKALESYVAIMQYLQQAWTEKEVKSFTDLVEKKVKLLSHQPGIGTSRNKKHLHIRHTVLHKRVSLIYWVNHRRKKLNYCFFGIPTNILQG
jgi:plasmid stabilization system protein ParE